MPFSDFKYLFTDEPIKALMERHIFNLFVFITSILFFFATLINYIANLGVVTFVSLAGGILLFTVYLISRFYIFNKKVIVVFIVLSFISLNALFLTNYGFRGPIVYNFLTLGMAILFFLTKKSKIIFTLLLSLNLIVLAIIEYNFYSYIGYYIDEETRIIDHIVNITFSLGTLALLYYLMLQYIETQKFKAEESDRLKSSFLANMSHEIRTPLNGIVGFSSLLNEANITAEEQAHFIEIIQSNSNHLATLINNLIDISTLEADAVELSYTPINLNSFMEASLKRYRTTILAKQKQIDIYLSVGLKSDNCILFIDKIRLNQVLSNLVSNAIDYSDSKNIHIGYLPSSTGKQIQFFVKDNGIGLTPVDQDLIFKPFLKAENAKYLSKGGTGIGLTIAKKLVELMGGNIKLESEIKKGTAFYFTVPFYKNPADIPV